MLVRLICTAACLVVCGCSKMELPEPESRPAKLYVQYCSGSGCHGPIPPQRDAWGIWEYQYDRMIDLMKRQGWPLPSPAEDQEIRDYIKKFARK